MGFFRVESTVNRRLGIAFDEKIKPQLSAEPKLIDLVRAIFPAL